MTHAKTLLACFFSLAALGCSPSAAERTEAALRDGPDVPRVRALVKEGAEKHVAGVSKLAARVAPLFSSEEVPEASALRGALEGATKPPEVIQDLVFSPADVWAVVDAKGSVLASTTTIEEGGSDRFAGRNLFAESPSLREAFDRGQPAHAAGKLGEGEDAAPYLFFIAPVEREGEKVAAVVLGYAAWKEGRRLTLQMRRETEQGDQRVLVIWAFTYIDGEVFELPNSPLEIEQILPDAAALRAAHAKAPEVTIRTTRVMSRELGVAIVPVPELGEDAGVVYVRRFD